jgi:hypothetical protein
VFAIVQAHQVIRADGTLLRYLRAELGLPVRRANGTMVYVTIHTS